MKKTLLLTVLLVLSSCQNIPVYDGQAQEEQAKMNASFQQFTNPIDGQPIHGVTTGKSCNPAVIFIHGAPGDWKAWGRYLGDKEIAERAFMIALDRPGYGGSSTQQQATSIKDQANLITAAALKQHPGPFLLVGHSYGGPIQMQMSMDFPSHISGQILLAGAIAPDLHNARWYHHLGNTWIARKILPDAIKTTAEEMLGLQKELTAQQTHLSQIKAPTTIIQGDKDWLVPAGNSTFAKENLTSAEVKIINLEKQGHFIPWEQYDLVKTEILEHLKHLKGC